MGSDTIVLEKGKLKQWALMTLIALGVVGGVYFVKKNRHALKMAAAGGYNVSKIERADPSNPTQRDRVVLKDGTQIDDIGYELKHLGTIAADERHAVLLFSGRECVDCGATEVLFAYLTNELRSQQIAYPGKVFEAPHGDTPSGAQGDLLQQTRVFIGKCLNETGPSILIYRNAREPGYGFKESLGVWSFREDGSFAETAHEDSPSQIAEILKVAQGNCSEISGRDFQQQ